jgi:hypothetical protein
VVAAGIEPRADFKHSPPAGSLRLFIRAASTLSGVNARRLSRRHVAGPARPRRRVARRE